MADRGDGDRGLVLLGWVKTRDVGLERGERPDAMAANFVGKGYLVAPEGHFVGTVRGHDKFESGGYCLTGRCPSSEQLQRGRIWRLPGLNACVVGSRPAYEARGADALDTKRKGVSQ
jgi:hypothetical protein